MIVEQMSWVADDDTWSSLYVEYDRAAIACALSASVLNHDGDSRGTTPYRYDSRSSTLTTLTVEVPVLTARRTPRYSRAEPSAKYSRSGAVPSNCSGPVHADFPPVAQVVHAP